MNNLISRLKDIILQAGSIAIEYNEANLVIEFKEDNSPVTNADKLISNLIYKTLKELTPEIPIVCEEQEIPSLLGANAFWLVDPIDGTRSYIRGETSYTINIALIKDNIPVIGLIYRPAKERLYYTDENGNLKIEKGGDDITDQLKELQGSNGIHEKLDKEKNMREFVAVVSSQYLNKLTKSFLQIHSITKILHKPSSVKLCFVAEGRVDIYPKFGKTMHWDIAAGHALILAAGGDIRDIDGKQISYGNNNFISPHFLAYGKRWKEK